VPAPLLCQLTIGGRLVIPIGETPRRQHLVRVIRRTDTEFTREELGQVQFVPLIGEEGWSEGPAALTLSPAPARISTGLPQLIREQAEAVPDIETADLGALLDRLGSARVVLLGEATHGSSEFYRMRARITRELITHHGFSFVAAEADWPDAAHFDRYARRIRVPPTDRAAFTRFPTWMWCNAEVDEFVQWLRWHNDTVADPEQRVGFHGLDLYSMFTSIDAVLTYLGEVDPPAAELARRRYGCLTPWEQDPARYGEAALSGRYRACEPQVIAMLRDLLERRVDYSQRDGARFIDAAQNARLIANAERYYRVMYLGAVESWNLRDRHMFDTLEMLLHSRGPESRAVVWAHNSHVGDAAATEMSARGEFNIGHLCREAFGQAARLVGFGTDRGTVAAATNWGGPMETKSIRPALAGSYERLFAESGLAAGLVHLREPRAPTLREELLPPRLERAIGVIYRPESELQSHYFQATLPRQFDEYVWFAETHAVHPVPLAFTTASSPAA
jgi:protein-L-isoaspartate(D-aspartate) O-methyltransferase